MTHIHNPGSPEAIAIGCTCPADQNANGVGYYSLPGKFVYTIGCPVHPLSGIKGTHMVRPAHETYMPTDSEIAEAKRVLMEVDA